ncbi:AraC family transcriptional regulator [Gordonia sp. TBRC 11910]|uniref:AraC family transcriptional regulator n=1 Tax=Gordonia asplenii TaxID=2725283 RepID=A0A848KUU8_9ACTN|nr:helix-turn-helix domain-containing protein [Gordonia asplenii]NMO02654.1 AraC family transcriptional regulator [Gordonia asplenii]
MKPPSDDTRGIIAPTRMMRFVDFARYPAPAELDGLVSWFWSVKWDLPMGFVHPQQVLAHPGVNISVGVAPPPGADPPPGPYPLGAFFNGVTTTLSTRTLSGSGWNIAGLTTPGAFGAWVDDVGAYNDTHLPLSDVLPVAADLAENVAAQEFSVAAETIGEALIAALARRRAARIASAREVARITVAAQDDRSIRTTGQLAALAGVTERTLQRMFASFVGVSPAWVIRRYRLIDAAEHARAGGPVDWAELAVDLGYADQSHLTRDFTATIGISPAAYATQQTGEES